MIHRTKERKSSQHQMVFSQLTYISFCFSKLIYETSDRICSLSFNTRIAFGFSEKKVSSSLRKLSIACSPLLISLSIISALMDSKSIELTSSILMITSNDSALRSCCILLAPSTTVSINEVAKSLIDEIFCKNSSDSNLKFKILL